MFRIKWCSTGLRGYQALGRSNKIQNFNPLWDSCFSILVLTPDLMLKLFIKWKAEKKIKAFPFPSQKICAYPFHSEACSFVLPWCFLSSYLQYGQELQGCMTISGRIEANASPKKAYTAAWHLSSLCPPYNLLLQQIFFLQHRGNQPKTWRGKLLFKSLGSWVPPWQTNTADTNWNKKNNINEPQHGFSKSG